MEKWCLFIEINQQFHFLIKVSYLEVTYHEGCVLMIQIHEM